MYLARHVTAKGLQWLYYLLSFTNIWLMWRLQKDIYKYKKKVFKKMAFFYSTEPNDIEAC